MSRTLQFKRYANTVIASSITGANGEIIVDDTNYALTVHDGQTLGGTRIATENYVINYTNAIAILANSDLALTQYAANQANSASSNTVITQGVDVTQNTKIQLAWNTANTALANANTALAEIQGIGANVFYTSGGTIQGNLTITGNTYANNFVATNTFFTGLATGSQTYLPYLMAQFTANNAPYEQINAQNINPYGSIDYVATADVGNDTNYFIDMGMQGSQDYDSVNASAFFPLDGYLYVQGSTINQTSGNLILGTTGTYAGLRTVILAGGSNTNNIIMSVNTVGANIIGTLTVSGTISGQTINYLTGVNNTQNTNIQSAFNQANSANVLAQSAFNQANSANVLAQSAYNQANTAAQTEPQNAQSTTYILQSSDAGKHIYYTNASAVNLYIPWTANTTFANGTHIKIISHSSSNVIVTPNSGVSLYNAGNTTSGNHNVTTYGVATLQMVAANTWYIYGNGVV